MFWDTRVCKARVDSHEWICSECGVCKAVFLQETKLEFRRQQNLHSMATIEGKKNHQVNVRESLKTLAKKDSNLQLRLLSKDAVALA